MLKFKTATTSSGSQNVCLENFLNFKNAIHKIKHNIFYFNLCLKKLGNIQHEGGCLLGEFRLVQVLVRISGQ